MKFSLIKKTIIYFIFGVTLVIILAPYTWIIFASIHPAANLSVQIPKEPTFKSFEALFTGEVFQWIKNSLFISLTTVVLAVSTSGFAGYALSRMAFKGKGTLMYGILLSRIIPNTLLVVPLFSMMLMMNLMDTHSGLVLVFVGLATPLNLWIMKGSIDNIPMEIEEAAMIEGASKLKRFFSIIFPLMRPGLATVSMMSFMSSWSQFLMPLILISSKSKYPISVGLFSAFGTDPGEIDYSLLAAICFIYLIPLIVFYFSVKPSMDKGLGSMGNISR